MSLGVTVRMEVMVIPPHDDENSSRNPVLVEFATTKDRSRLKRVRKAGQIATRFFFGQGATQGVSLLANVFLIHTLSIEAYAQFGIAIGFQSVFSILMDLGFGSTIIPMVGENRNDAALIGRYVRSARHLRTRLFWILSPIATIAFLTIIHKHHWSLNVQVLLLASVLLSLYSSGKVSYFSAPLFIFGRLKEYYFPQVITGTGRLLAYLILSGLNGLNAAVAAGLNAINITINGNLIHKNSTKYFEWPDQENDAVDRELLRYILPASPAIIFSAFQSQISLFLVSIFGGTLYIAQVAVLSRIGQLFTVLLTFFTIVVEPYVARVDRRELGRTFFGFVLLTSIACVPLVWVSFFWPKVYLWLVGTKYKELESIMGVYILSLCLNCIANLMWIMNRARKWVFWSGSILEVLLLLGVQGAFLAFLGVSTTRGAVFLGLASSFCYLIAHGYVTLRGFIQDAPAAA